MKGPTGKTFDGIYSNSRFIHSAASLVGSVVNIQVKNGTLYEGVFRTFSQKVDFVLEMVHKVDGRKPGQLLVSDINPKDVTEKMIFSFQDVVMLSAVNIDMDFAAQDNFTDTAISKFNGQIQERTLEPWDGGLPTSDAVSGLGEANGVTDGWDPDEMFKTNEEHFGVKSSFDSNLRDYTIQLKKQNTEEYKNKEAKAGKIAYEIESSSHSKSRIALENGDEEEMFSAVVRPDNPTNNNNNKYTVHRGKKIQVRPPRSSPSPTVIHSNNRVSPHPSQQNFHKMNSPNSLNNNNSQNKMSTVKPVSTNVHSTSSKPVTPPSMTSRQPSTSPSQSNSQQHMPVYQTPSSRNAGQQNPNMQNAPLSQPTDNRKLNNGDVLRAPKENLSKETVDTELPHKNTERSKEVPDKKPPLKKSYESKTSEELKKFHDNFKLDNKEGKGNRKEPVNKKPEPKSPESPSEVKQPLEQKPKEDKDNDSSAPESNIPTDASKSSLNPNAKEFVLNPNAKSFTPRTIPMATNVLPHPPPVQAPPVQPPPRLHAQSPVIAVPQHPLVPSMHPMFTNVTPHYVLPATPVANPVGTPYTPATSMAQQAPRFRKTLPVSLPRNDSSQSIHVQAATGQPILAPPTVPAPQFTIQYHSPSILHSSGPPQPQLAAYAQNSFQMYQMVGPRMIAPQPLGMVPTAGPYGESPHVPGPIFMNPQAVTGVQHPGGPNANSGQHSASSTPQSQTPSLHPAPSPVHQQPPPPQGPQHGQPPTPTGHPGNPPTPQVIYHGQLAAQHPLHINPAPAGHAHPYQVYNAPQPILMLPQPGPHPHHASTFQALQNHYHHAQTAGPHAGTPNQILPHPSVQMMPTSTAMGQVPVSNSPYVPHSQV